MKIRTWARGTLVTILFTVAPGISCWLPTQVKAQAVEVPQFKYDASWPKPLPDGWVLGSVGSVCVDARDHVFAVTRGEPAPKERNLATPAPPVIEFDADGNVVNSWGNRGLMAKTQHGCFIDKEGNFWTAGNNDGIVQKYTHDGSKMLLQIGTKGVMDSADGTATGKGLNASHTSLFGSAQESDNLPERAAFSKRWLLASLRG